VLLIPITSHRVLINEVLNRSRPRFDCAFA
jgi:hypothetical protein